MYGQLRLTAETGVFSTQYNDVRAPNDPQNQGTLFSFSDDFDQSGTPIFIRGEIAYTINDRHTVEATAVPLTVEYSDAILSEINFQDQTFVGEGINGTYQFNTYRGSYRYGIVRKANFSLDLGASILVRDARIALTQGAATMDNTDLGFVPLVSFEMNYSPINRLSFLLKGDALVGPVGRAEDIFAGILFDVIADKVSIRAGYRLIEGGADVAQVYNFAYFHFGSLGLSYQL